MAAAKMPDLVKAAETRAAGSDLPRPLEVVPGLGDSAYASELRGMQDRSFCFSQRYGDQQGRADRTGADPRILEFERKLIKRAFKLGVPLFAHCVVRGSAEQSRLFREGRSKARPGESAHNFGAAVDVIHSTKAWDLSLRQWAIIGHLGNEVAASIGVKVVWGGDDAAALRIRGPEELGFLDNFRWDPAHWELADWRDIRARYADGEDWDGRPSL